MIVYIYSEEEEDFVKKNKTLEIWPDYIQYLHFSGLDTLDLEKTGHLLVTGGVKEIKQVIALAYQHNISVGIIPTTKQKELISTLELPSRTEDAITLALTPATKKLDILFCNDIIVLQEVVIGDTPPLDHFDTVLRGKTIFRRIQLFWMTLRKVKELKHTQMKITDGKANEMTLSAVGAIGVEYNNATFAAKLLSS